MRIQCKISEYKAILYYLPSKKHKKLKNYNHSGKRQILACENEKNDAMPDKCIVTARRCPCQP